MTLRATFLFAAVFLSDHVSAQSVANGSFNDPNGAFVAGKTAQMAPSWVSGDALGGSPDWDRPPGTSTSHKTVPASPDGGLYIGMLAFDAISGGHKTNGESILQKGLSGFIKGRDYRVTFHQINIPEVMRRIVGPEVEFGANEDGYLSVTLFGATLDTPRMTANGNYWSTVSLQFTATGTTSDLKLQARDANPGSGNTSSDGRAYMAVDGVVITPAPVLAPLRNFDVVNRTGQHANDFHVTLQGVTPDQVGPTLWLGSYPHAETTAVPGGTRISWRGSGTPPGGREHFGYNLIGANTRATGIEMEWTRDGVSIGRVPAADHSWKPISGGGLVSEITLGESFRFDEIFVLRSLARLPGNVFLEDLLVDGPAGKAAERIDPEPVQIGPGQTLELEVSGRSWIDESVVVIYDLWSQPVDPNVPREELEEFLLATYFEAFPLALLDELRE